MDTLTAQNIFLDENTGGKGRHFTSRFLQPGLVKYSFGVCLLSKETIDKFIYQFVGCPVIINHKDVTNESAKDDRMGVVSRVWFDQMDGWYWCEGIIFEEQAISLIEDGYNVSCQYEITEYSNNTTKALHNGNPYDKVILNGKPEHLAIVKTPRYEAAMIAVNAIDLTADNARGFGGEDGDWITVNGVHIFIKKGESKDEVVKDFIEKQEKGSSSEKQDKKEDKSDTKEGKDLYSDENFKYNAKRLNEQFGEKPYSEWQKDVQTMLKKYGKTEEDFDNAIGARKDAFKQSDKKEEKSDTKDGKLYTDLLNDSKLIKHLKDSIAARKADNPDAKVGDTIIDSDSFISDYVDKLTTKEYAAFEWNRAEKLIFDKLNEMEKDAGFKSVKQSDSKGDKATTSNIKQSRDEHGRLVLSKEGTNKKVKIHKNGNYFLASYGQELKDDDGYTEFQLFPSASGKSFKTEAGAIKWANKMLADNSIEPNIIIQAINEIKETNMFKNLFNKKEQKMEKDELKEIFMDCIQDVLKAQNEAEEEKKKIDDAENEDEEKEEKAENKKACNEDKRKLIDEVAGMMKSAGCDDEVIRTAIAKMEKIGYDKSEAGTADNGKKAKCEDEEEKEEALNKAKNSIEVLKGLISQTDVKKADSKYITKAQAIELGNQLF